MEIENDPSMVVHFEDTTQWNSTFHFTSFNLLAYYNWTGVGGGGGSGRETKLRSTILKHLTDRVQLSDDQTPAMFYILKKPTLVKPWNDFDINKVLFIILGRRLLYVPTRLFPDGQDTEVRDRFKTEFLTSNDLFKLPALHLWKVYSFTRNGETWRCIELSHCNKGVQYGDDQYCDQAGVVGRFVKSIAKFVKSANFAMAQKTVVRFSHYISLIVPDDEVEKVFEDNVQKFIASPELFPEYQYKLHLPALSVDGKIRFRTLYRERESVGQNCNAPAPPVL